MGEGPGRSAPEPLVIEGLAGSPGLAFGPAVVVDTRRPGVARRRIPKHLADEEMQRFLAARERSALELREVIERIKRTSARRELSVLEAYVLMVEDETLREEVERRIHIDLQSAEWALDSAMQDLGAQLAGADDAYLAERSHDFAFIRDRILRALSGKQRISMIPQIQEPSVVIARDLSPAETATLSKERVKALVTEVGTRTSHTAIVARALGIPAVVGVRSLLSRVDSGDPLLVDGSRGRVTLFPSAEIMQVASERAERYRAHAQGLRALRDRPALTRCGTRIELRGNIELPAEADLALQVGAQGIGLYRTEFLYVDRSEPPDEEEQYRTFRRVIEAVDPLPLTLRTFDIGGDKFVTAFPVPEDMNPALGLRAVRLGLARPELFLVQLRAMVRASAHGTLRVMVPMVASLNELRQVQALLNDAISQVDAAGQPRAEHIPLGAMVEVPAAAIMADELAAEAAFLSIGTNDLVQYALAVDRSSRELAYLASPYDPAILRLIANVVRAAERHGRPLSVCGAMANDPMAAILLVGMGLRELSMEGSAILQVKSAIGRLTLAEAEEIAEAALGGTTASEVEERVAERLTGRLADLLTPS